MAAERIIDIGGSKLGHELRQRLQDEFISPQGGPRSLPTEIFYDTSGLELWSQIVETTEYTQMRNEISLMAENAAMICQYMVHGVALIDMGSG